MSWLLGRFNQTGENPSPPGAAGPSGDGGGGARSPGNGDRKGGNDKNSVWTEIIIEPWSILYVAGERKEVDWVWSNWTREGSKSSQRTGSVLWGLIILNNFDFIF